MLEVQCPEVSRPRQAINVSVVKRARTSVHQAPRKSVRLAKYEQKQASRQADRRKRGHHDLRSGVHRGEQRQKPVFLARSRRQNIPAACDSIHEEHPIAYWAANDEWPPQYFEEDRDMENILARKRSVSSMSRQNSDTDSATPSSTGQGEQKSREQKSAEYKKPQYATVLATKGVFLKSSPSGVTKASQECCKTMLDQEQKYPPHTMFRDDLFDATCESVQDKNETRVIRDIALLIVPSAEVLAIRGATHLQGLVDSVNEGWNNSIPLTKTRPQPDFAVGFHRDAFSQERLDRMHPIVGDFNDQSYFMATWYMYFPFLTCEVKCGAAALDVADRQNAHSMAIAVRAVVELFRAVKREKELHREILAYSISHDHRSVRIYGYYAEIDESSTKYYRHSIRTFDFTELHGKEKWTAYQFTKNVYDRWMPEHFKRICSAIDQIPANISFSVSQSESNHPGQTSGLSQDLGAHSIVASSAGSASIQAQGDSQSSTDQDLIATPSASLTGREFKKPKRGSAQRGRE
ncbi:hypothetical protein LTR78_009327 [Recurvomyces mirabilis]|uniref:DUF7924 domain-containing protein n=1 Tax=Recurvomyces mirabilis TaxID=574656 RepID=A0AAE0TNG3_9PEZI|nr:hypothetical protein LTR78_009327 [Recurvomyces mirabilis]KAK5150330.1 hypothetical protein LTS14_010169 [Recurvomyces mirabilis]